MLIFTNELCLAQVDGASKLSAVLFCIPEVRADNDGIGCQKLSAACAVVSGFPF
jgi:hypothetical protein